MEVGFREGSVALVTILISACDVSVLGCVLLVPCWYRVNWAWTIGVCKTVSVGGVSMSLRRLVVDSTG